MPEPTSNRATTHFRTCPLREAMCGLAVTVDGDRVTSVRPDADDVWSRGYVCPKGATLGHLHHDPDRLRAPLVRDGETWREVGWDEAFRRCDELLRPVLDRHGKDAVTCYIGNPTAHNFSLARYVGLFMGLAQLPIIYSAGTVDQWPKNLGCMLMYGNMWAIPTPDLQRTQHLVIMGGNPHASQGSLLACADVLRELDAVRAPGGRVVVIDPRRTGTAERADEWIPIAPGRSRVRGIPEVLGQVPLACLAEEITTPGTGQVRALVAIAGNPVISAPDAGRLDAALPELACMISVDNYLNETTRHAHVILPGLSALEQPHFDDLIAIWAVRSAGNFSPAILPPPPERPAEWDILLRLGAIVSGMRHDEVDVAAIDDGFFSALCMAQGLDPATILARYTERGPERLLDLQIRTGPFGDRYGDRPDGLALRDFVERPHGIDMGPLVPRLPEILATPSGKVELAPAAITADVPRLRARLDRTQPSLTLVSRRHLRSNNSWMHNVPVLVSGRDRCTLLMHPDDARRTGVADGGMARIASDAGAVVVPVEVTDEMMPGVVSLPHGWGHDRPGTRLAVASAHAGVNSNLLAPGGLFDPLSNNAVVNGFAVAVTPAD